jgi:hypothetical protein
MRDSRLKILDSGFWILDSGWRKLFLKATTEAQRIHRGAESHALIGKCADLTFRMGRHHADGDEDAGLRPFVTRGNDEAAVCSAGVFIEVAAHAFQ